MTVEWTCALGDRACTDPTCEGIGECLVALADYEADDAERERVRAAQQALRDEVIEAGICPVHACETTRTTIGWRCDRCFESGAGDWKPCDLGRAPKEGNHD